MAYCRKSNILFIHIPKNAGKSIECALGFVPQDKVSNPGAYRSTLNRFFKKMHYITNHSVPSRILFGPMDVVLCAQHLSLTEIESLRLISKDDLNRARTFAVVRNPFDRAISVYRRFYQEFDLDGFKKFWAEDVNTIYQDHGRTVFYRTQYSYVANLNGEIAVDRILKFESLAEDFKSLCEEWGLGYLELAHLGRRSDQFSYHDVLDCEARKLIEVLFARDIDAFGYTY